MNETEGAGLIEGLYSYKEKKGKENLENFFTELIVFMCEISPTIKNCFVNSFLNINVEIDKVSFSTQVSSRSKTKKRNRPDLIIYNREDVVIGICEHKIEAKPDYRQLKNYYECYKDEYPSFFIITTMDCDEIESNHFLHKRWEIFYEELKNINEIPTNIERILIHSLLNFMYENDIFAVDERYLKTKYNNQFSKFCKKIRLSLLSYYELKESLKPNRSGSRLTKWITEGYIYKTANNKVEKGFQVDIYYEVSHYKYDKENKKKVILNDLSEDMKVEILNNYLILQDLYKSLESLLNGTKYQIINMDYLEKNKLKLELKKGKKTSRKKKVDKKIEIRITKENMVFQCKGRTITISGFDEMRNAISKLIIT